MTSTVVNLGVVEVAKPNGTSYITAANSTASVEAAFTPNASL